MNSKCGYCKNYINENCKYCDFEYFEDFNLLDDDWDILELDDDVEFTHKQIKYRLNSHNIPCFHVDVWNDDMCYIIGCNAYTDDIANVLNIHHDCIYNDFEYDLVIINLFQEKYLRGLLE